MIATETLTLNLDLDDVLEDLEAGRSRPLSPGSALTVLPGSRRPAIGGPASIATMAAVRATGAIRPGLARGALERLWFTAWVHPSAQRPVTGLPAGARSWTLRAGRHRLVGYEAGSGPTVLLLHGWAGRAADLRHVGRELVAAGFRVVAPDLPGHGNSSGDRTNLYDLAEAVTAVLRAEGPVHGVVTHSLGFPATMVAVEGGATIPPRIVAIAPGRAMKHALSRFAATLGLAPALRRELESLIEDRFGADIWEELVVDRTVATLGHVQALLVHDRDDDEVDAEDAEAIAAAWPGARLQLTEGLGHRRILREPGVIAATVSHLAADAPNSHQDHAA